MKYRKWVNKMAKKVAEQSLTKNHIIGDFCVFWLFKKDSFFIYYYKTDFYFLTEAWGILGILKNCDGSQMITTPGVNWTTYFS